MSESRDFDCFAFEQLSTLNALEDAVFSNAREFFGFEDGEYQHVNREKLNSFLGVVSIGRDVRYPGISIPKDARIQKNGK